MWIFSKCVFAAIDEHQKLLAETESKSKQKDPDSLLLQNQKIPFFAASKAYSLTSAARDE